MTYDVAIVGAGYVGVPLAQTFADAGRRAGVLSHPYLMTSFAHSSAAAAPAGGSTSSTT